MPSIRSPSKSKQFILQMLQPEELDPRLCTRRVSITACPFRARKLKSGILRFARSDRPASLLFSNILKGFTWFHHVLPQVVGQSWVDCG